MNPQKIYEDAAIAYQDALERVQCGIVLTTRVEQVLILLHPTFMAAKALLADETAMTLRDEIAKLLAARQAEAVAKKYEDGKKLAGS